SLADLDICAYAKLRFQRRCTHRAIAEHLPVRSRHFNLGMLPERPAPVRASATTPTSIGTKFVKRLLSPAGESSVRASLFNRRHPRIASRSGQVSCHGIEHPVPVDGQALSRG